MVCAVAGYLVRRVCSPATTPRQVMGAFLNRRPWALGCPRCGAPAQGFTSNIRATTLIHHCTCCGYSRYDILRCSKSSCELTHEIETLAGPAFSVSSRTLGFRRSASNIERSAFNVQYIAATFSRSQYPSLVLLCGSILPERTSSYDGSSLGHALVEVEAPFEIPADGETGL